MNRSILILRSLKFEHLSNQRTNLIDLIGESNIPLSVR